MSTTPRRYLLFCTQEELERVLYEGWHSTVSHRTRTYEEARKHERDVARAFAEYVIDKLKVKTD